VNLASLRRRLAALGREVCGKLDTAARCARANADADTLKAKIAAEIERRGLVTP